MSSIAEGVDSSPVYYTAVYSDTSNKLEMICGSENIKPSSCLYNVCTSSLPSSCYHLNGSVKVSLTATNGIGEGPSSTMYIGKAIYSLNS